MSNPGHFYIFIRTDLPLADQICQVAHAAAIGGKNFEIHNHASLVLLQVANQEELAKAQELCNNAEISSHLYWEPEIKTTALCTAEIDQAKRSIFKSYRLWKPDTIPRSKALLQ